MGSESGKKPGGWAAGTVSKTILSVGLATQLRWCFDTIPVLPPAGTTSRKTAGQYEDVDSASMVLSHNYDKQEVGNPRSTAA